MDRNVLACRKRFELLLLQPTSLGILCLFGELLRSARTYPASPSVHLCVLCGFIPAPTACWLMAFLC